MSLNSLSFPVTCSSFKHYCLLLLNFLGDRPIQPDPIRGDCLSTFSPAPGETEECLPKEIPAKCFPPAFEDLQNTYEGKRCPDFPIWQNSPVRTERPSVGLGAPEYLSVLGHEDCLDTYSPAPGRLETCMPKSIPDDCIPPAWEKLKEVFTGVECPEFPLWQN